MTEQALPDYGQEISFWKNFVENDNGYVRYMADPVMPIGGDGEKALSRLAWPPGRKVKVLDVGCGPLSAFGRKSALYDIELVGVDPLIDKYDEILRASGFIRPFKAYKGQAEHLVELFGENSFDLVFSRNALDHSFDPARAIQQCVAVCRPGGVFFFTVFPEEAVHANYTGLHQWNFSFSNGDVNIWSRNRSTMLSEIVESFRADLVEETDSEYPYKIEVTIGK